MENINFYFTNTIDLAGKHKLMRDVTQIFFKNVIKKELGNKYNLVFSNSEKIGKHLEQFYMNEPSGKPFKTDVAGIIVPICHGDINDIFHIATSIPGYFNQELINLWKQRNFQLKDIPLDTLDPEIAVMKKKRGEVTQQFLLNAFDFPIFEAYKYFPGYRGTPGDGNIPIERKVAYVRSNFVDWIKKEFKD